jgi:stage V sporulation protein G
MEISDVRVKLMDNAADRLKAVCSVTFDGEFVVRDLKVVDGTNGLFVAMPSRKLAVHCPQCRHKNHLRAHFCNDCGAKLPPDRVTADANGRVRLHRDIAHPINPAFRELVQTKVIERYAAERELAAQPGYKPADLDAELDEIADAPEAHDAPVVAVELTEYDALIAGLRSGTGEHQPSSEFSGPSPRVQPPAPRGPKPGPGPKRSDDDSSRRPSRPAGGGRGDRPSSAPPRQPNRRPASASVAESGWRPPADDDVDDPAPAAPVRELISAEPEPAPPKPTAERQPTKPAPSAPSRYAPPPSQTTDDDQPFGAGIL